MNMDVFARSYFNSIGSLVRLFELFLALFDFCRYLLLFSCYAFEKGPKNSSSEIKNHLKG